MKKILFFLLLLSTFCHSQKIYNFDYILEYQYINLSKKEVIIRDVEKDQHKLLYLINSKDNHYVTEIRKMDSINYAITFNDRTGISANVLNRRADFDGSETLNLQCQFIHKATNPYKFLINEYDFANMSDTIINEKTYGRYKLFPTNLKRAKRKKIGVQYYLIDKTENFAPILIHTTAYEEYKSKKNIPNGLLFQTYYIGFDGKLIYKTTLINKCKAAKMVLIGKDCADHLAD